MGVWVGPFNNMSSSSYNAGKRKAGKNSCAGVTSGSRIAVMGDARNKGGELQGAKKVSKHINTQRQHEALR